MRPQMPQVRNGVWRSRSRVPAVAVACPMSAIPGPSIPGDHPLKERDDVAGEEAEQGLALLAAGLPGIADMAGCAPVLGDPATRARLERVAEGDRRDRLQIAHQV